MPSNKKPTTDRRRARTTPEWLHEREDLDEMARRRCLMVLSVLSGERPVTDVIAEAQISRGTYYNLEERALKAMLVALVPGATEAPSESPAMRIAELEKKVARLEQEKRRGERLLLLTRKTLKRGPMKMEGHGRPSKQRGSTTRGKKPSLASGVTKPRAVSTKAATPSAPSITSTPTPAGAAEP
jgi:hypothetical protein